MNICFIGANGFVAQAFGKFYEKYDDVNIHVIGRSLPKYRHKTYTSTDLSTDFIDFNLLCTFDVIFYFAGEGVQSNKIALTSNIYRINTFLIIDVLTVLRSRGYKGKIITFGSYAEIGNNDDYKPFKEAEVVYSALSVPNDYVVSKRLLTRFIESYKTDFCNLHFIIPTVYGKGENENRLLPYILKCKELKKSIHLTSGHQVRQYLYIEELPIIVHKAVQLNIERGIYNVEGPDNIKIQELVALAAEVFDIASYEIQFSTVDRWDTSMNILMLNGEKLSNKLNYKAVYRLNETIKKYLD